MTRESKQRTRREAQREQKQLQRARANGPSDPCGTLTKREFEALDFIAHQATYGCLPTVVPDLVVQGGGSGNPSGGGWGCAYLPTMNNWWHDDVLCSNGAEHFRPDLLPDDSFITEAEMVAEARRYEAYLNSQ